MRYSKVKALDIERDELAENQRRQNRAKGFNLMDERDRGYFAFDNGATMLWHVDKSVREDGVCYSGVPEDHFILNYKGQDIVFDADTFRKALRWV